MIDPDDLTDLYDPEGLLPCRESELRWDTNGPVLLPRPVRLEYPGNESCRVTTLGDLLVYLAFYPTPVTT